ncbi:MAG TPA: hypothetical protein VF790_02375 [Dissulfurispiraceae bacterium]
MIWRCIFIEAQTADGDPAWIFAVVEECTQECLSSVVEREFSLQHIADELFRLFLKRGIPKRIRPFSDDAAVKYLRAWLDDLEIRIEFEEQEGGYGDLFREKLSRDLLNEENFATIPEMRNRLDDWKAEYNWSMNLSRR